MLEGKVISYLDSARGSILACLLLTALGALLSFNAIDRGLFHYDEADFVTAAKQGFMANYSDTNSLSLVEFVKKGVQDVFVGGHSSLSKEARDRKDINLYRHFHAPFLFYLLWLTLTILGDSEFLLRFVTTFIPSVLIIPAVYWLCLQIFQERKRLIGLTASLLIAVCPVRIASGEVVNAHPLYTLTVIFTIFSLVKLLQTQRVRYLYLTGCFLSLAFLTVEYALFLFLSCLLALLIVKNPYLSVTKKQIGFSYHLFGGVLMMIILWLLFWPAGVLKLSFVKNYLAQAYYVLVKKEATFGELTVSQVWFQRFQQAPVESLLILFSCGYFLYGVVKQKISAAYLPLLLYPLVIFLINIRNTYPRSVYVLSMYPMFMVIVAFVLLHVIKFKTSQHKLVYAAMVLIVAVTNLVLPKPRESDDISFLQGAIEYFQQATTKQDKILISYGYLPTMSYYLPQRDLDMIRVEDNPKEIEARLQQGQYDYFMFVGVEQEFQHSYYSPVLTTFFEEVRRITGDGQHTVTIFRHR